MILSDGTADSSVSLAPCPMSHINTKSPIIAQMRGEDIDCVFSTFDLSKSSSGLKLTGATTLYSGENHRAAIEIQLPDKILDELPTQVPLQSLHPYLN